MNQEQIYILRKLKQEVYRATASENSLLQSEENQLTLLESFFDAREKNQHSAILDFSTLCHELFVQMQQE